MFVMYGQEDDLKWELVYTKNSDRKASSMKTDETRNANAVMESRRTKRGK